MRGKGVQKCESMKNFSRTQNIGTRAVRCVLYLSSPVSISKSARLPDKENLLI